jgi:hypothetical protein
VDPDLRVVVVFGADRGRQGDLQELADLPARKGDDSHPLGVGFDRHRPEKAVRRGSALGEQEFEVGLQTRGKPMPLPLEPASPEKEASRRAGPVLCVMEMKLMAVSWSSPPRQRISSKGASRALSRKAGVSVARSSRKKVARGRGSFLSLTP